MASIIAKDLVKVYNDKYLAVDSIDFQIEQGEVYGFLGPNGAGKSTTMKMIIGLLQPTSGTLEVLGEKMPSGRNKVKHQIGYIPQDLVFYDHLTVDENINVFAKSYRLQDYHSRKEEVYDLLGLDELSDRIAEELSGGQKRRLNVALGLLHNPKLLVMDEPSAGMDPQSRNILWEMVEKLSYDEITIILTTHLMDVADLLTDKVCIIDHGKILTVDTPSKLKKLHGTEEIIELIVNDKVDQVYLDQLLHDLSTNLSADTVTHRSDIISINMNNGLSSIQQILNIINPMGKEYINQIQLRQSTLEDVFISLTGRDLRE